MSIQPAHTDWYYNNLNADKKTYSIATAGELFGFAKIVNEGIHTFGADETVCLTADITVNFGTFDKNTWVKWQTINKFAGTFDGQGHKLSGIYVDANAAMGGIFGEVTGTLCDFTLSASEFTSTKEYFGAIVGYGRGNLDSIYVDETVNISSTGNECGGLVGRYGSNSTATMSNCWFAGTVTSSKQYCGGLVGRVIYGNKTIQNCLSSGTVTNTFSGTGVVAFAGGLVGGAYNENSTQAENTTLTISNCLSTATVKADTIYGVGALVGRARGLSSVTLDRVYTTNNSSSTAGTIVGTSGYPGFGNVSNNITGTPEIVTGNLEGYGGFLNTPLELDNTGSETAGNGTWVATAGCVPVPKTLESRTPGERIDLSCFVVGDTLTRGEDVGAHNYQYTVSSGDYDAYYAKLVEMLGAPCASSTVDNVSSFTFAKYDLVLVVTRVNGTNYVSVSSGETVSERLQSTATSNTVSDGYTAEAPLNVTFGMPRIESERAMSFVTQLKNGHFVVYDGGEVAGDLMKFMSYLTERSGGKKPIIDAWIVSHAHNDHLGIAFANGIINNRVNDLYVEGIYFNQPTDALAQADDPTNNLTMARYEKIQELASALKTTRGTAPKVYRPHTGQTYYFDGMTVDVVLTQEFIDIAGTEDQDFNETSTWCMFNVEGGSNPVKILVGADGGEIGMNFVNSAYSNAYCKIDVFGALHHGSNTHETINVFKQKFEVDKVVLYAANSDPLNDGSWSDWFNRKFRNALSANRTLTNNVVTGISDKNGANTQKYMYYGQGTVELTITPTGVSYDLIQ